MIQFVYSRAIISIKWELDFIFKTNGVQQKFENCNMTFIKTKIELFTYFTIKTRIILNS